MIENTSSHRLWSKHRLESVMFCQESATPVGGQVTKTRMDSGSSGSRPSDSESDCPSISVKLRRTDANQRIDAQPSTTGGGGILTYRSDDDGHQAWVAAAEGGRTLGCCDVDNLWTSLVCLLKSRPRGVVMVGCPPMHSLTSHSSKVFATFRISFPFLPKSHLLPLSGQKASKVFQYFQTSNRLFTFPHLIHLSRRGITLIAAIPLITESP
jgi:hypothetical protein